MNLWNWGCILVALSMFSLLLVGATLQEDKKGEDGEALPTQEVADGKDGKKDEAKGDPAKGKQVFADNCQTCHYAESEEANIGPGLKGLFKKPPHKMADGTEHTEYGWLKKVEDSNFSPPGLLQPGMWDQVDRRRLDNGGDPVSLLQI